MATTVETPNVEDYKQVQPTAGPSTLAPAAATYGVEKHGPSAGYLVPQWFVPRTKTANPSPLGLCAFAMTTFVLSLVNMQTRNVTTPNVVVGLAFFYGGLIQLLAGMWELASPEGTFAGTALSSYGGFWLSYAAIVSPWFGILSAYSSPVEANHAVGFYLMGWFIFTVLMWLCTFKSTLVFNLLFFFLWLAFLMLGIAHLQLNGDATANQPLQIAGGVFGILAAFLAWWSAMAGLLNTENSFFTIPVYEFPWGAAAVARREKVEHSA